MLGLRSCARAFSSCGERGPLFIAVRGPLTIAASLLAEHRLQTRSLSNCGSQAQLLRGMWDLPRPGLEPVYPALAGRFSTTAPPGKPQAKCLKSRFWQGHAVSKAFREGSFFASSSFQWLLAIVGVLGLWEHSSNLCLCLHVIFPMCPLCLQISVFRRAPTIEFRAHHRTSS